METILAWLHSNVGMITTAIFGVGVIGGVITKLILVINAVTKLLNDLKEALADKTITPEEFDSLVLDAKGIPIAIKAAFKK